MNLVEIVTLLVVVPFAIYLLNISRIVSGKVTNLSEFLSFGKLDDEKSLERTFEATNATFLTSFISLFIYTFTLGFLSIWIPISFCIGIFIFNKFFLNKMMPFLLAGKRLPEVLGENTDSNFVKLVTASFFILNLWLFTFAEVQGFLMFLDSIFNSEMLSAIIPIILLVTIAIYTSLGGFKAVLRTDKIQVNIIRIGAISILFYVILMSFNLELSAQETVSSTELSAIFSKQSFLFIIPTFIGFVFAQIIYYDNWQRLSFYVRARRKKMSSEEGDLFEKNTINKIKSFYNKGAIILLGLYLVPVILGFFSNAFFNNSTGDHLQILISALTSPWVNSDSVFILIIGSLFISVIILNFFSALMSTADSYIIGTVNVIGEDLLSIFTSDELNQEIEKNGNNKLKLLRVITFFVAMSFLPFIFIKPDFELLFLFMFYSVNGFIGPTVWVLAKRNLNPTFCILSISFAFIYAFVNIYSDIIDLRNAPFLIQLFFETGFFTVVGSFLISGIGTKKQV